MSVSTDNHIKKVHPAAADEQDVGRQRRVEARGLYQVLQARRRQALQQRRAAMNQSAHPLLAAATDREVFVKTAMARYAPSYILEKADVPLPTTTFLPDSYNATDRRQRDQAPSFLGVGARREFQLINVVCSDKNAREKSRAGADDVLHRQARALDRRPETAGGGAQAVPGEGQAAIRAHRLGRPAWRIARESRDGAGVPGRADRGLQHQRCDHDAQFRERAHVLVVHARRRHGAAGDDRLAEPHHRARPRDLPRAAVGGGGGRRRRRLDSRRRVFQQRRAVSLLATASAAQAARAPEGAQLESGRRS